MNITNEEWKKIKDWLNAYCTDRVSEWGDWEPSREINPFIKEIEVKNYG